jgi:hypothetical protein
VIVGSFIISFFSVRRESLCVYVDEGKKLVLMKQLKILISHSRGISESDPKVKKKIHEKLMSNRSAYLEKEVVEQGIERVPKRLSLKVEKSPRYGVAIKDIQSCVRGFRCKVLCEKSGLGMSRILSLSCDLQNVVVRGGQSDIVRVIAVCEAEMFPECELEKGVITSELNVWIIEEERNHGF